MYYREYGYDRTSVLESAYESASILISQDYTATLDDYYIGVDSEGPVIVTLPVNCLDGDQIIVKLEMGPPIGNRKVTVKTVDGSMIDDAYTYVMESPYDRVHLFCRGGDWHIVS